VSGQIKYIQHGMVKRYYLSERSFPGPFSTTSPDLIIILDQAGEIIYVNDASSPGLDFGSGRLTGKTLGELPHPVIHHPDFFSYVREASFHKVIHLTLAVPGEQGDHHYPVTITRIGISPIGQGTLIIIEGAIARGGFGDATWERGCRTAQTRPRGR
jgi:PAS domain-containing protein